MYGGFENGMLLYMLSAPATQKQGEEQAVDGMYSVLEVCKTSRYHAVTYIDTWFSCVSARFQPSGWARVCLFLRTHVRIQEIASGGREPGAGHLPPGWLPAVQCVFCSKPAKVSACMPLLNTRLAL